LDALVALCAQVNPGAHDYYYYYCYYYYYYYYYYDYYYLGPRVKHCWLYWPREECTEVVGRGRPFLNLLAGEDFS